MDITRHPALPVRFQPLQIPAIKMKVAVFRAWLWSMQLIVIDERLTDWVEDIYPYAKETS